MLLIAQFVLIADVIFLALMVINILMGLLSRILYVIVYLLVLCGVVFAVGYLVVNYSSFSNDNVMEFVELVKG